MSNQFDITLDTLSSGLVLEAQRNLIKAKLSLLFNVKTVIMVVIGFLCSVVQDLIFKHKFVFWSYQPHENLMNADSYLGGMINQV